MSDRFYADSDFRSATVELAGAESHHLAHVMRREVGDEVVLFNGRGLEARGEIVAIGRRTATIRIMAVRETGPDPANGGRDVTLAVAAPKGERFRWLVEKSAELGVRRLVPLKTARSVVEPGAGKLQKARQAVIEAAKQCGAGMLMEIDELTAWDEFLGRAHGPGLFVAHPGGRPLGAALDAVDSTSAVCVAVGPEGGFTAEEIEQSESRGAIAVDLGPHVLRVETAALAAAACARLR